MTYFTGRNLEVRIKNSGLDGLYTVLEDVAHGKTSWGRPCYISVADPADLEPLRNLIYSILNKLAIKQLFTVKLIGDQLLLDQKRTVQGVTGIIFDDAPQLGKPANKFHQHIDPGDVLGPEHLETLFEPDAADAGGRGASPSASAHLTVVEPPPMEYDPTDTDDPDPLVRQFLQTADMGKNSPIYKTYHRLRLIFESPETYEADRSAAAAKMAVERRNMEKAIRAAGLLAAPLKEEED